MFHPGCGSAFPTIPCNARIFLLDLEKKSPQMVLKPSHSSCVTCFYFLSPCSVPFFSLCYFPWLDFTLTPLSADSGADVSEGGTGHQLGNCASNPEILYEMKALYWLREIHLFWNVMELGWPWNILIIVLLAAPSNLQWEGQEKIWIPLASWFVDSWK